MAGGDIQDKAAEWGFFRMNLIPFEWLAGIGAFIIGAIGLYLKGRSDNKAAQAAKDAKAASKTRERMDNAPIENNPDHARAWLDHHAKRLRDAGKS